MCKKKFYRDFYGGSASIARTQAGLYRLRVRGASGALEINRTYNTLRGARIAMGRYSDGWTELPATN